MHVAHRWGDRNLTKLELIFAILTICMVIFFISKRTLVIFAAAEKNHIDYTVTNINTALQLKSISYLTENRMHSIMEMKNTNPMRIMEGQSSDELVKFYKEYKDTGDLMKQLYSIKPTNYLGELVEPDLNEIEKGSWYYDLVSKKLVYTIRNDEFFYTDISGPARLIYSVNINFSDINNNRIYDYDVDEFNGLRLIAENEYEWQI